MDAGWSKEKKKMKYRLSKDIDLKKEDVRKLQKEI